MSAPNCTSFNQTTLRLGIEKEVKQPTSSADLSISTVWTSSQEAYLKEFHPNVTVLSDVSWKNLSSYPELEINFDDYTPISDSTLDETLKKFNSLVIEGKAGFTLITIPKGWTFEKLKILQKYAPKIIITHDIEESFKDVMIEKTMTVALTNSIIENTRNISLEEQKEILDKNDLAIPGFLITATLITLTFLLTFPHVCLFNDNPNTYTRNNEKVREFPLMIGHNNLFEMLGFYGIYKEKQIGMAGQKIIPG